MENETNIIRDWNELDCVEEQISCIESDEKWLRVIGSAGTGKSVALCRRAKRFLEQGDTVLLISGQTQIVDNYIYDLIRKSLEPYFKDERMRLKYVMEFFGEYAPDIREDMKDHLIVNFMSKVGKRTCEKVQEEFTEFYDKYKDRFDAMMVDHVLVDEAQDVPMEALYIFGRLARKDFTIAATHEQSIFCLNTNNIFYTGTIIMSPNGGFKTNWMAFQEALCGEGNRFTDSCMGIEYRMTDKIFEFSRVVLGEKDGQKATAGVEGEKPRLVSCNSQDEELKYLLNEIKVLDERINKNGEDRRVGIICSKYAKEAKDDFKRDVNGICSQLEKEGIKVKRKEQGGEKKRVDAPTATEPGIYVLNVADAKGLEFEDVYVFLDKDTFLSFGKGIKEFYVAVSRARLLLTIITDANNKNKLLQGGNFVKYLELVAVDLK